jgi:predicted alpha/beta-hydrolase family hydrolase
VETGASAVLLLAFPLVPPAARNDRAKRAQALAARSAELAVPVEAGIPVVVAQGQRDVFGTARQVAKAAQPAHVVPVVGADHSLLVARGGPDPAPALLAAALAAVDLATG